MEEIVEVEYYNPEELPDVQGTTPLGYFDDDSDFQDEVPKIAKRIGNNLGYPVNDLEITNENIYASIEEAVLEYSVLINEFKTKEDYFALVGKDKEEDYTDKILFQSLQSIIRLSDAYGTEAGVGGSVPLHVGHIETEPKKQMYNLHDEYFSDKYPNENTFSIRRVYHNRIPSGALGVGYGSNLGVDPATNARNFYDYGGVPRTDYYTLAPLSWDVTRMQYVDMSRELRLSHYGFEINGNVLRIFPVPRYKFKLYFHYNLGSELQGENLENTIYESEELINDPSKVNFKLIPYSNVNPKDKAWIFKYAEALVKITLGENRRKFASLQYPNGDISLNGDALVNEGREDIRVLKEEMREYLLSLSKERGLEIKNQTLETQMNHLRRIPLGIYVV